MSRNRKVALAFTCLCGFAASGLLGVLVFGGAAYWFLK